MFSNNYFTPTSSRNVFAQRARQEEARRRAIVEERFYREQEQQRWEAAEAMRREEAHRRVVEQHRRQEQRRRQELEQRRRREEAMRQRRVQHYEEEPQYGIVRGRDGYLYRVRLHDEEESNGREQRTTNKQHNRLDAREEMRETRKSAKVTKAPPVDNTEATHVRGNAEKPSLRATPLSKKDLLRKNAAKKVSNVMVEDASDSESEDSELNSVWRNRRPSPGEWMEPVAAV